MMRVLEKKGGIIVSLVGKRKEKRSKNLLAGEGEATARHTE